MRRRPTRGLLGFGFLVALILEATPAAAATIPFDATKHEMAGNADWVIDADAFNVDRPAYPCTSNKNEWSSIPPTIRPPQATYGGRDRRTTRTA